MSQQGHAEGNQVVPGPRMSGHIAASGRWLAAPDMAAVPRRAALRLPRHLRCVPEPHGCRLRLAPGGRQPGCHGMRGS